MSDRILCPNCEKETDGVLSSRETDSDGYTTETYQCYECMEIYDRVYMPKDMHIVVCEGCAAGWTFRAPEGKRVQVKLTCQCGAITEYDSEAREASNDDRNEG